MHEVSFETALKVAVALQAGIPVGEVCDDTVVQNPAKIARQLNPDFGYSVADLDVTIRGLSFAEAKKIIVIVDPVAT